MFEVPASLIQLHLLKSLQFVNSCLISIFDNSELLSSLRCLPFIIYLGRFYSSMFHSTPNCKDASAAQLIEVGSRREFS